MACVDCNGNCGKCGSGCPPAPTSGCNTCNEAKGFATGGTPAYFFGVDTLGVCRKFAPLSGSFDLIQHAEGPPNVDTDVNKPFYFDDTDLSWYVRVNGAWRSTTDIDIVNTNDAVAPSGSGNPSVTFNTFRVLNNGDTYFIDSNGVSMAIFSCTKLKAMMESDCIANLQSGETINKVFVQNGAGTVRKAAFDDFAPKVIAFNLLVQPADYGDTAIVITGWNQTVATDMFWVSRNGSFNTVGTPTIDTTPDFLYTWNPTGLTLFQPIGSSVNAGDEGETFQIICIKRPLP